MVWPRGNRKKSGPRPGTDTLYTLPLHECTGFMKMVCDIVRFPFRLPLWVDAERRSREAAAPVAVIPTAGRLAASVSFRPVNRGLPCLREPTGQIAPPPASGWPSTSPGAARRMPNRPRNSPQPHHPNSAGTSPVWRAGTTQEKFRPNSPRKTRAESLRTHETAAGTRQTRKRKRGGPTPRHTLVDSVGHSSVLMSQKIFPKESVCTVFPDRLSCCHKLHDRTSVGTFVRVSECWTRILVYVSSVLVPLYRSRGDENAGRSVSLFEITCAAVDCWHALGVLPVIICSASWRTSYSASRCSTGCG